MTAHPSSPSGPVSDALPEDSERELGPYRIVRPIGQGGMGTVYEAVHATIGHRVAIKRLRKIADDQASRRIIKEARALGAVAHPGLVRVLDVLADSQGAPCLVLEYLDGQTLRARSGRPLGLQEVVEIGQQLAMALLASHRRGVIHRDLKPENVMLVPDPELTRGERVKILDFGIARLVDAPELATRTADGLMICGTPAYMSPEQCTGELPASEKSDVYALGVVLYEMLCGQPPFHGEPSRLVRMHVFQSPRPPHELRPDVPAQLERLCLRMLAKTPAHRPTMAEVATRLGQPLRPMGPGIRAAKKLSMFTGLGALGLGTCVLLGCFLWLKLSGQVLVTGGEFTQGAPQADLESRSQTQTDDYEREIIWREGPERRVRITPFLLDRTEVPSAPVTAWLNRELQAARACADYRPKLGDVEVYAIPPAPDGSCPSGPPRAAMLMEVVIGTRRYYGPSYNQTSGRFELDGDVRRMPAVLLTHYGASAFCESVGKRLPSEAEWEFAARGPTGRLYPWGKKEPGCDSAVYGRETSHPDCLSRGEHPEDVDAPTRDESPFGALHMSGNVGEWVEDRFDGRYAPCPSGVCIDPMVPSGPTTEAHLFRGGTWYMGADSLLATGRGIWPQPPAPGKGLNSPARGDIGFRCARSLKAVSLPLRGLLQLWMTLAK